MFFFMNMRFVHPQRGHWGQPNLANEQLKSGQFTGEISCKMVQEIGSHEVQSL